MSSYSKPPNTPQLQPSLPWRTASSIIMGITGGLCRWFYFGFNKMEVVGLERFLETLDRRKDIQGRERGLVTVSNHVSVIDDPLIWGVLPFKYAFDSANHRWSLGSHDLCFTNKALSTFFSLGQVLPAHRKKHSQFGGLFQPTITQAIRLLSAQPFISAADTRRTSSEETSAQINPRSPDLIDPFTSNHFSYPTTYSTNGTDTIVAPSAYPSRKHSWVHIFPEGLVHQHPDHTMRYFKWGVSRLILETEPMPQIVPIFIDGNQQVMNESRTFPRFIPRANKKITIAFGESVDGENVFGDLRAKWQRLVRVQREALKQNGVSDEELEQKLAMGELTDCLKYSPEAVQIREEVTRLVRIEVLKVRRSLGYPDEGPKEGMVETWREEGDRTEGMKKDGSWVKDV